MVRTPLKVLVLPFHRKPSGSIEYAVFKKGDNYWQGIAGGVEEGETVSDAAKREAEEEGGITGDHEFVPLDATSSFTFDNKVITQYSFAVELKTQCVRLSEEHSEFRWLPYDEALRMLRWDGDRAALDELHSRLARRNR